jgi:ribonuclease HI
LFNDVDMGRILQIPMNVQSFEDFIAWSMTSHGRYTVCSGYYIQRKHQFGTRASQLALPGTSAINLVWKILWQLKLSSKVKIFIWRALHGILPLKCILANRHIGTSGSCPICNQGAEDVRHLLFQCPAAKDIWQALDLNTFIDGVSQLDRSGSVVLELIIRREDNTMPGFQNINLKELVLTTCWYLWWTRHRLTHDQSIPPLSKRKLSILAMVANSEKACGKKKQRSDVKWIKPDPRQVKLNVDAAFHDESKTGSIGAIIRDYLGNFVAAWVKYFSNVASATMAEAYAMKEGLALARDLGCNRIIAELDSIDVIEACKGESTWWNELSAIYADCTDIVVSIGCVTFGHIMREANEVAHELAKYSHSNRVSCSWSGDPPSFILDRIINDVTVL